MPKKITLDHIVAIRLSGGYMSHENLDDLMKQIRDHASEAQPYGDELLYAVFGYDINEIKNMMAEDFEFALNEELNIAQACMNETARTDFLLAIWSNCPPSLSNPSLEDGPDIRKAPGWVADSQYVRRI
jgi:hypothetical protein